MTSWQVTRFRKNNEEGIFLNVEDCYEQVQINLGPNVGDITIGLTRPGGAGLSPWQFIKTKPMRTLKAVVYYTDDKARSPRAT